MKNVSIPSTPSPTHNESKEGGECINIEKLVKENLRQDYFSLEKTPPVKSNVQSTRSAKQMNVRKSLLSRV